MYGEREEAYTGYWWGNLRERELGRSRREWEDNRGIIIEGSFGSGMWGYGLDQAGSG
jgi:hypothetical protein